MCVRVCLEEFLYSSLAELGSYLTLILAPLGHAPIGSPQFTSPLPSHLLACSSFPQGRQETGMFILILQLPPCCFPIPGPLCWAAPHYPTPTP